MEAHGDLDDDSEEDADFDAGADSGADEDDDESGASDDEDEVGAPSASTLSWTFCGRLCLEVDQLKLALGPLQGPSCTCKFATYSIMIKKPACWGKAPSYQEWPAGKGFVRQ